MVSFDDVASGDCVISNSGGVTNLSKDFKMLGRSVMQSSLCLICQYRRRHSPSNYFA